MKKLLLLSAVLSIFVFVGCNSSTDANLMSVLDSGKLSPVGNMSHNWGDINISGGKAEYTFKLKNDGDDDLIIKSATTSCMCTTVEINVDGTVSPIFGMHGNNPWGYAVKPGQEFEVKAVFDPMAHGPDAVGPIQRSIYLMTSSIPNGTYAQPNLRMGNDMITELKLEGEVLYDKDYKERHANAAFFLSEIEHDFGIIKQSGGTVSYDFDFTYMGDEKITVTGVPTSCACTSAKISPTEYEKGDKGVLTVIFDPNLHEEPEGKFFKTVNILTDPELEEKPEVKIWAEIDLDLGPEAYKLKEPHDDEDQHENGVLYHNVNADEFSHMLENKDFFLVDVHIPEQEHIEGTDAVIAYNEIEANLDQLPKDKSKKIVVYCRSGSMSLEASQKLIDLGYTNVTNLQGGINAYMELTN